MRVADPKACQCGEVLKGVIKPWECKVFGTACTPERPIGTCMVSPEGACAAYYNYGRYARDRRGDGVSAALRASSGSWRSSQTARSKRPRFRDEHITMAHGAGGKASQSLIEGLLLPALQNDALAALGDAGTLTVGGAELALTTDSFVVRPIRFPGGSIGELAVNGTVNDLAVSGARAARADALARARGGAPGGGAARGDGGDRAGRRRAPGCSVIAGDTKVVERGHADGMYVCTTGHRRDRSARAALALGRSRRATASCCPGRIGEHGMAIMLARGEFELEADDRLGHALAVAGRGRAARSRRGRRCTACATPPAAAWPRRSTSSRALGGRRRSSARPTCRSRRRSPAPPSCSGSIRCTWPTRASSWRSSRPTAPTTALAALRTVPGCEQAAEIGEVAREPPGMVLVETAFGGRRVMDLLAGDPLPRIC